MEYPTPILHLFYTYSTPNFEKKTKLKMKMKIIILETLLWGVLYFPWAECLALMFKKQVYFLVIQKE